MSNILDYVATKFVYLEGNLLENLPDNLFLSLPVLKWLDVRNNKLTQFPKTVAYHDNLQVLLLQGNQIQRLPLELGLVPKLRGLQLLGNPLKFPPDTVVQSGVLAILEFLRQECSPSTVRPVEKLTYVKSTNGSDKIKKGKPKTHSSAISKRRLLSKVARPKAMSADLPSIMVKGYRHERELVAPKPTPAPHGARSAVQYSTCAGGVGVMAGELRPDRGITNLHNFHSVEEKISHLWPRTSPRPSTSHSSGNSPVISEFSIHLYGEQTPLVRFLLSTIAVSFERSHAHYMHSE
uniref:Uncharacterized protein n=1 Tax=Timema cristinae TaxID=61476 RepID=A0A7R9CKR2_TIMCR|nr:unnamed protein product [Timema cristinae]